MQTILKRNDYLMSIDGIMDKINLVFDKDAAGATKHYILKCHPDVRGLIHQRGDVINWNEIYTKYEIETWQQCIITVYKLWPCTRKMPFQEQCSLL